MYIERRGHLPEITEVLGEGPILRQMGTIDGPGRPERAPATTLPLAHADHTADADARAAALHAHLTAGAAALAASLALVREAASRRSYGLSGY